MTVRETERERERERERGGGEEERERVGGRAAQLELYVLYTIKL